MRLRIGLSLRWWISSVLTAPVFWGLAGGLDAVFQASSLSEAIATFLMSVVYAPLFALIIVAMFAPLYALVFVGWPWLAGWLPFLERSRSGLGIASVILALPAALTVANSRAQFGPDFRWSEFAEWFTMAITSGSMAILGPRLFWRALAPGAFAKATG